MLMLFPNRMYSWSLWL